MSNFELGPNNLLFSREKGKFEESVRGSQKLNKPGSLYSDTKANLIIVGILTITMELRTYVLILYKIVTAVSVKKFYIVVFYFKMYDSEMDQ